MPNPIKRLKTNIAKKLLGNNSITDINPKITVFHTDAILDTILQPDILADITTYADNRSNIDNLESDYISRLSTSELIAMKKEARAVGDNNTKSMVKEELQRRNSLV